MSDAEFSPDAPLAAATPADGRSPAPDRSESIRTELAALSAILTPVDGSPRPEVLPSLQASLGSAYVFERELGGGGMSRVFVATETALGRRVAVKVLSPELLQGVSAERFAREVALAARLQAPHIVPVLPPGPRRRAAAVHDALHRGGVAAGADAGRPCGAGGGGAHPARTQRAQW